MLQTDVFEQLEILEPQGVKSRRRHGALVLPPTITTKQPASGHHRHPHGKQQSKDTAHSWIQLNALDLALEHRLDLADDRLAHLRADEGWASVARFTMRKLTVRARRHLGDELGERGRALRAGLFCLSAVYTGGTAWREGSRVCQTWLFAVRRSNCRICEEEMGKEVAVVE